jgi:hypothetical protein
MNLEEYTSTKGSVEQQRIKRKAFDAFAGMTILETSDQNKYGSLLQVMSTT